MRPSSSKHRLLLVLGTLVIVAVGALIGYGGRSNPPATTSSTSSTLAARSTSSLAPPADLSLVSSTPSSGATGVGAASAISLSFSAPLATDAGLPTLVPSTAGSWAIHGAVLTFTPSEPFIPLSQVTLSIPAGLRAASGAQLSAGATVNFTIAGGSVLRLQQLLSLLEYSPLSWTPTSAALAPSDALAQRSALFAPPAGSFAWRAKGWPSQLVALSHPGRYSVMTRGLVMSFQADHGLDVTGLPSAGLWNDLLAALANGTPNTGGYNFALADKARPEYLTIWHNGAVVLHVPANTGIAAAPTPDGDFPVYARYRNEVMRGRNPDGSSYADPVQYVAYFHDGDAVHYLARADYGIPQSLGCVELSLADAASAWPWLAYGTLVTVID